MTTTDYRPGTPVRYGLGLGYITAAARMNGLDGYDVLGAEPNGDPGQLVNKHWIPATGITPAVLDENVCGTPFPMCTCPMLHVRHSTLETFRDRLERLEAAAAPAAPAETGRPPCT